jgi:hypothetical protein
VVERLGAKGQAKFGPNRAKTLEAYLSIGAVKPQSGKIPSHMTGQMATNLKIGLATGQAIR